MNQRVPLHRRTGNHRGRNYLAIPFLLVAMVTVSSCVSTGNANPDDGGKESPPSSAGPSTSPGSEPDAPVIASSVTSSTEANSDLRIDIHSLKRQQNNNTVVLDFSMSNLSGDEGITALTPPKDGAAAGDFQPFSLIDGKNKKKHLPLLYSNGECYCSDWQDPELSPGESIRGWVAFSEPPEEVKSMILTSAITPPIMNIPLTQNEGEGKPASGELASQKVWDLHSIQDDLKSNTVREETGEEIAVSLSTDVLFAVGKSDLTDKADDTLQQVAQEIDGSSGNVVQIDGHTDSTGTAAINDPLSLRRAEAVEGALSDLVSKSEITYKVDGHGADDPIATNETEEGKRKNRRVTITFTK